MALDADETTQTFEIFGIPQSGSAYHTYAITTLWGPFGQAYDCSAIVTQLTTILTALTASQLVRVRLVLVRWNEVTSFSPLAIVEGSAGGKGRIVDYDEERKKMRRTLSNIIGFSTPPEGFSIERTVPAGTLSR